MHSRQHEDTERFPRPSRPRMLRRSLGLWLLVLYGLGVIIGAGIYVLIGTIVETAGNDAHISFIVAGLLAAATGISYAELNGRVPGRHGTAAVLRYSCGPRPVLLADGLQEGRSRGGERVLV